MPTMTVEYHDDAQRLLLEQAIAYLCQLRQVALDAPDGSVLDSCEKLALAEGRSLLRSSLAAALQARIASSELKGGPRASAIMDISDAPKAATNASS